MAFTDTSVASAPAPRAGGVAVVGTGRAPDLVLSCLIGLLGVALVAFQPTLLDDGDTFWHLGAGAWILDNATIPTTDPFSYSMPGHPWHAHEWLAEAFMTLVYRAGGWSGLLLAFGAVAGLTLGLLTHALQRWFTPLQVAVILVAVLPILAGKLLARPHVLAFPVLLVWLGVLVAARARGQVPHWGWLGLMVFWANLHGSFLVGLGLVALMAGEALLGARTMPERVAVVRSWGLFGTGCLLASFATPFGLNAHLFAFQVSSMQVLGIITEWFPTGFEHASDKVFWAALGAGLLFLLTRGVKLPVLRTLAVLVFLYMALAHVRHQTVFVFLALMLLAPAVGSHVNGGAVAGLARTVWPSKGMMAGLAVVLLAVAVGRMAMPIERGNGVNAPVAAVAALPEALREQPMLNKYGFGGYLIYAGLRPFVDGRADMYGDAFVLRAERAENGDRATLEGLIAEFRPAWTIYSPTSRAAALMDAMPGWRRLHADEVAVVHVRAESPVR